MNVYIPGTGFATQGPCDSGFHVPLDSEWTNVYNIWTALGGGSSDGTNFGIALKLPFAGNRDGGSSNVLFQGSRGYYWSSTYYDSSNSYGLRLLSSYIFTSNKNRQTDSLSIRPFKNSQIVPTNSWTKLYGTSIESGGIFWNESEGLISLSSDGTNWVTISDKNLGATTVWNNGDTLSESNCGKYYQRGNNNGFAWTGSVTTSSTKVNAGSYGPGNYYSSSTFITVSSSPYNRDSSNSNNLRGGVDGNVQVMNELKNAYIGKWWSPGSNTIAYYPLTSTTTVNDMSGNNRNGTKYGTINFSTYNGVDCAYFNGGSNYIQVPYDSGMSTSSITISLWAKTLEYDGNRGLVYKGQFTGQNGIYAIAITQYQGYSFDWRINGTRHGCNVFDGNNIWTHILVDFNGSTGHVYKNGSLISTFSQSQSISSDTNKLILGAYFNSSYCFYGYLSNIILENKVWTATEVSNYYNLTKSNYGL